MLQLSNFTHVAHVPSAVKNHVGASGKCSSVGGFSGRCLRGFSRTFRFFSNPGLRPEHSLLESFPEDLGHPTPAVQWPGLTQEASKP